MILGQDLALGYESHSQNKAKFSFNESFTVRVVEPAAVTSFIAAN